MYWMLVEYPHPTGVPVHKFTPHLRHPLKILLILCYALVTTPYDTVVQIKVLTTCK